MSSEDWMEPEEPMDYTPIGRPGATKYRGTLKPMDVRGWSWKQIVMGAATLIHAAIRELAEVHRHAAAFDDAGHPDAPALSKKGQPT